MTSEDRGAAFWGRNIDASIRFRRIVGHCLHRNGCGAYRPFVTNQVDFAAAGINKGFARDMYVWHAIGVIFRQCS